MHLDALKDTPIPDDDDEEEEDDERQFWTPLDLGSGHTVFFKGP